MMEGTSKTAAVGAALAGAALVVRLGLPLRNGAVDALGCAACRACDATGDLCPAEIPRISEMVLAAHTGDLARFIRNRGLLCIRCENCSAACPANLDLTRLFASQHAVAHRALAAGELAPGLLAEALDQGLLGATYLDDATHAQKGK